MNPAFVRYPKVFKSSKNDLRSLYSPSKPAHSSRRPEKLSFMPPHGEDCDVDDEESTASPLYTDTPQSSTRAENLAFSPFAPSIPRSPNHMKTSFRAENYLSKKEGPHSHRATLSSVHASPPKKQLPALRHLRPHFMRASLPASRRNPLFPCDEKVVIGGLCLVLPFCSLSMLSCLAKVCKRLHRASRTRLREVFIEGIDPRSRQRYWRHVGLAIKSTVSARLYFRAASHCSQEIKNDILRTPSLVEDQLTEKQQRAMMRLLDAVSTYDEEVGYCQGMNYIAALLVQVMDNEEDYFWLFNSLMQKHKLKNLLMPGFAKLQQRCFQLDCFLQHYLPDVSEHLKAEGVSTEVFAAKWFVTLLSYELPHSLLVRVWDLFFAHGWKSIFRVILAIISQVRTQVLDADSSTIASVLSSMVTKCDDSLLKKAFEFKVTHRLLRDLKKLQNSNGRYRLEKDQSHKLQWVVTPCTPSPEFSPEPDDGIASRFLRKVLNLFQSEEVSSPTEESNLESTICMEELPVPPHAQAIMQNFDTPEVKEELAIKDLDSGRVYYIDLSQEHCFICGANTHSSRYCTADVSAALWVFPSHL